MKPDWWQSKSVKQWNTISQYRGVHYKMKASERQVGGSHYKDLPIQPGEFIRKNNLGWYEGNAIKYICRYKQKGGKEDLEKVKHYIDLILEEIDSND